MTKEFVFSNMNKSQKLRQGVLAQLGEHLPYKQRVTGSSPVGPSIRSGLRFIRSLGRNFFKQYLQGELFKAR